VIQLIFPNLRKLNKLGETIITQATSGSNSDTTNSGSSKPHPSFKILS